MMLGDLCRRDVVAAYRDTRLVEAARIMRERHVGSLVIVMDRPAGRVPIGILTDRDIVVATLAKDLDPHALTAGEVMSSALVTLREDDSVADALSTMRNRGIRRIPVVTRGGALAGLIAMDDLIGLIAAEIGEFARIIDRGQRLEAAARR